MTLWVFSPFCILKMTVIGKSPRHCCETFLSIRNQKQKWVRQIDAVHMQYYAILNTLRFKPKQCLSAELDVFSALVTDVILHF